MIRIFHVHCISTILLHYTDTSKTHNRLRFTETKDFLYVLAQQQQQDHLDTSKKFESFIIPNIVR